MVKRKASCDSISIKSEATTTSEDPNLLVHPLTSQDGLIIKVDPPKLPTDPGMPHVPCDIVLVVDVSRSMNDRAPAPMVDEDGNNTKEDFGFTILDLTKHAARMILETLNEGDRLGIVTFSNKAKVVQPLLPMNVYNKDSAKQNIESMKLSSNTNLWHGIREGLRLFDRNTNTGRVPAIMVLTDGQPNTNDPPKGYVRKLRGWLPLPATIHTFGFGIHIKSALLKSIAEIAGGNYAYIADSGMIATVIIHAIAHLQSTFATRCTLEVTTPRSIRLRTTGGNTLHPEEDSTDGRNVLTINLGNLQYGQSRDVYLKNVDEEGQQIPFRSSEGHVLADAELKYSLMREPLYTVSESRDLLTPSPIAYAEVAYHRSRSLICDYFSSFFNLQMDHGYQAPVSGPVRAFQAILDRLLAEIPAKDFHDPNNVSLMEDLIGKEPAGQVRLAISCTDYWTKWGRHYYLSMWNAHAKQLCNTFKDPGPQRYGLDSPFFQRCRDALDDAFDTLQPLKSTYAPRTKHATNGAVETLKDFNNSGASCFSAASRVLLESGEEVPVSTLRKGASVRTPLGGRRVAAVLRTPVEKAILCGVRSLRVTPWHPIKIGADGKWVFPIDVPDKLNIYSGAVYSILLEEDDNVDAHAVKVGGVWCVTLGHGVVTGDDARAHAFFGDHAKVAGCLDSLSSDSHGVKMCDGVQRDGTDGLVCGFMGAK